MRSLGTEEFTLERNLGHELNALNALVGNDPEMAIAMCKSIRACVTGSGQPASEVPGEDCLL